MPDILPLADVPADAVEALLDRAFGPDRHGRTAYRLRAGTRAIPELSFAAIDGGGQLVGSIQCWPAGLFGDGDARPVPLVLVGPVAVAPELQRGGIGRRLMARALAGAGDDTPMLLIGSPEYYGRFGFDAAATGGWRLPGPWDAHRLLARGPVPRDVAGTVGPWLPKPVPVA